MIIIIIIIIIITVKTYSKVSTLINYLVELRFDPELIATLTYLVPFEAQMCVEQNAKRLTIKSRGK